MKRFSKLMTAVSLLITVFACYPPDTPDTIEIPVGNPETSNKVKVFIMAGQSNMQGHGEVYSTQEYDNKNGGMGTLEYLVNDSGQSYIYDHLIKNSSAWVVRDDVWLVFNNNNDGETVSGPLSVGYGAYAHCIGPELQFGHIVGDRYESQVLIIKEAWGGKSLHVDFRPPSSGGQVGEYYTRMVNDVHDILDAIDSFYHQGTILLVGRKNWRQNYQYRKLNLEEFPIFFLKK